VHEHHLMNDLMRRIGRAAEAHGGERVVAVSVWLGALSHMTPDHFREHFEEAAVGTLAEGARLAGRAFGEPLLGTLVPGAPADLVVLDYAAPAPREAACLSRHWIFGLSARSVRDVMVAGEWVVRDRRLARADERELAAGANAQAQRLWRRLDDVDPHGFEPKGG